MPWVDAVVVGGCDLLQTSVFSGKQESPSSAECEGQGGSRGEGGGEGRKNEMAQDSERADRQGSLARPSGSRKDHW